MKTLLQMKGRHQRLNGFTLESELGVQSHSNGTINVIIYDYNECTVLL